MAAHGSYVDANGVRTFVAQHGAGDPVLLLHGGLETVDMLPELTAALAQSYHVIAPERRGHGRTPDAPGPTTYEAMTADTLAVMDALGIECADLVGYSDGANVGMLLAIDSPERVSRLVLVSGNFHPDGMTAAFRLELSQARAETYAPEHAAAYRAVTPDGADHWPEVFEKVRRMWLDEPRLTTADLGAIAASTLVLAGEDDDVSVEHTRALAQAIPARLSLVPGGSHGLLTEQAELTTRLILEFLDATETG